MHTNTRFTAAVAALALGASMAGLSASRAVRGDDKPSKDDGTFSSRHYVLETKLWIANDNDVTAPTLFGRVPTRGVLNFVGVGEVIHGQVGTTVLDGAKFGFLGKFTGEVAKDKPFDAVHFYLDENASPQQRRALAAVIRIGEKVRSDTLMSMNTTPITVSRPTGGTDAMTTFECKIGDYGSFKVTPILGGNKRDPIGIVNPCSRWDEREPVILCRSDGEIQDGARKLVLAGNSGEIHVVRMEGSADEPVPGHSE